jgi:transposase
MRLVEPKTVLFRARERIVRPCTELVNALRAVLYEFGQIIPQGIHQIKRIEAIIANEEIDVPQLARRNAANSLRRYLRNLTAPRRRRRSSPSFQE